MQNNLLKEDLDLIINDIKCTIIDIKEWLTSDYCTLATREFNSKRIKQYQKIIKYLEYLKNIHINPCF